MSTSKQKAKPETCDTLLQTHRSKFEQWQVVMQQGFSLLLYGVGSKRTLLDEFTEKQLTEDGLVKICGHTGKNVNIKNMLITIIEALRCKSREECKGLNIPSLMKIIEESPEDNVVYLVVHNIEYGGLGKHENQLVLANLASMKNIHLAATVDNVNSDLLWDSELHSKFRWFRQDATTFLPYTEELKSQPEIMKNIKKQANEKRVLTVLSSLPQAAKKVFLMLGQHALENPEEASVLFEDLLEECQNRWVVNNEQILRQYLTELVDHELVLRGEDQDEEKIQVALVQGELQTIVQKLEDEFDGQDDEKEE